MTDPRSSDYRGAASKSPARQQERDAHYLLGERGASVSGVSGVSWQLPTSNESYY